MIRKKIILVLAMVAGLAASVFGEDKQIQIYPLTITDDDTGETARIIWNSTDSCVLTTDVIADEHSIFNKKTIEDYHNYWVEVLKKAELYISDSFEIVGSEDISNTKFQNLPLLIKEERANEKTVLTTYLYIGKGKFGKSVLTAETEYTPIDYLF